jgi:hypothetical protein
VLCNTLTKSSQQYKRCAFLQFGNTIAQSSLDSPCHLAFPERVMIHPKPFAATMLDVLHTMQMVRICWPASRVLGFTCEQTNGWREVETVNAKNTPYPASFSGRHPRETGGSHIPVSMASTHFPHAKGLGGSHPHTTLHGAWLSDFLIQTSSWSLPREVLVVGTSAAHSSHLAGFLLSTSNMQEASQESGRR